MVYIVTIIIAIVVFFLIFLFFLGAIFYPKNIGTFEARKPKGEGEIITINDFNLWFKKTGKKEGKTIIVLHGGPGLSSTYFENSLRFLEEKNQVVYFDQRGCGYSEVKPDKSLYKMKYLVEDLESIRSEVLKKDKIILLAHSAGCQLAMRYAIQYQHHIDKMILVSAPSVDFNFKDMLRYSLTLLKNGLPEKKPELANDWYAKSLHSLFSRTFHSKEHQKYLKKIENASFGPACYIGKSVQNRISNALKNVMVETLIIYGENELFYTSEKKQKYLHETLSNSQIKKFNESGHWSFFEEPEKFKNVVDGFLDIKKK